MTKAVLPTETRNHLSSFQPRHYQQKISEAVVSEGGDFLKLIEVSPRRSGKDVKWWRLTIRAALSWRVGLYLYCLPTASQARSVIWEGMDNEGNLHLDAIPEGMISKKRDNVMTINLINGSVIRCVGSDNYDRSIVGSNPVWVVFSEYAQCDENAYKLAALPVMKDNQGVCAMISTPRGKNHMYDLFSIASESPDWYSELLTVDDTKHISLEEIQKSIDSGEISEDLALQEFFCSFEFGQEGSYYAKYIDKMKLKGQIGVVPHDPYHRVCTAWDLGIKDPTCIIFFEVWNNAQMIKIIDYYEKSDMPMSHFAKVVLEKDYNYQYHFPPHDVMARESGRGITKKEMYYELGIEFTAPVDIGIDDGIELVRKTLSKVWIDEEKCKQLLKNLENYRQEFDNKRKIYKGWPLHDWSSHGADAMRYLCASIPNATDGMSADDAKAIRRKALYGREYEFPKQLRDNTNGRR